VPLSQGDRYNLLILEQLSSKRPCWQEKPGVPGGIEPLLLQFDFTNICGRSTDSNGYSIRIAGEDKGVDYRLSIQKQGDHLQLVGLPNRSTSGPALEIAHTESLAPGFLKLTLNPEWRLSKRAYQGKALGHIYLARNATSSSEGGAVTPYPPNLASGTSFRHPLPRTGSSVMASAPLFRSHLNPPTRSLNRASAYSGSISPITAPIQIQVPEPQPGARSLRLSSGNTSRPVPLPVESDGNSLPTLAGSILPVPSANIPLGRAGDEPDLITSSTPSLNINAMTPGSDASQSGSFQVAMANYRFKVYVNPADSSQQRTVKTLVPDSFRAFYKGRSVLQVGAFQERSKANEVMDLLSRNGITGILSTDN
jgi:Protein of unknown function (DUF3747)